MIGGIAFQAHAFSEGREPTAVHGDVTHLPNTFFNTSTLRQYPSVLVILADHAVLVHSVEPWLIASYSHRNLPPLGKSRAPNVRILDFNLQMS